jgi:hypothetical protein
MLLEKKGKYLKSEIVLSLEDKEMALLIFLTELNKKKFQYP